jgi:phosphoesterase RecJ-like protein
MNKNWKKFLSSSIKTIKKNDRILIGTHIDPDSDGICAALSCATLVEHFTGTKPRLYCQSTVPSKHSFLMDGRAFLNRLPEFDLLIAVDSTGIDRVIPEEHFKKIPWKQKTIINIDHHRSNNGFGDINYVDEKASSACEIIYRMFQDLKVPITSQTAGIIYSGIYIETGGFAYPNTTNGVFAVVSDLVSRGVRPSTLLKKLHGRTLQGTRLLSAVLDTIKIKKGVGVMHLSLAILAKTGARISDSEHFLSFLQAITNVHVSVFLREEKRGTRVSLRSDGLVDVNEVASRFGGGGHRMAAGMRMPQKMTIARKLVLAEIDRRLNADRRRRK